MFGYITYILKYDKKKCTNNFHTFGNVFKKLFAVTEKIFFSFRINECIKIWLFIESWSSFSHNVYPRMCCAWIEVLFWIRFNFCISFYGRRGALSSTEYNAKFFTAKTNNLSSFYNNIHLGKYAKLWQNIDFILTNNESVFKFNISFW